MAEMFTVAMRVNGAEYKRDVEARRRLGDFLRDDLHLTGTHLACEQGACGACTVIVDGVPRLACLTLAVQADKAEVQTVEGLANGSVLSVLQEAFQKEHALQCGYCTPGFLMALTALFQRNTSASDEDIEEVIDGLICRCTGYIPILKAAIATRDTLRQRVAGHGT